MYSIVVSNSSYNHRVYKVKQFIITNFTGKDMSDQNKIWNAKIFRLQLFAQGEKKNSCMS